MKAKEEILNLFMASSLLPKARWERQGFFKPKYFKQVRAKRSLWLGRFGIFRHSVGAYGRSSSDCVCKIAVAKNRKLAIARGMTGVRASVIGFPVSIAWRPQSSPDRLRSDPPSAVKSERVRPPLF